jgi:hypothetical protein
MCNLSLIYIIICEGDSEVAYVQELNKYFWDQGITVNLVPQPVKSDVYCL